MSSSSKHNPLQLSSDDFEKRYTLHQRTVEEQQRLEKEAHWREERLDFAKQIMLSLAIEISKAVATSDDGQKVVDRCASLCVAMAESLMRKNEKMAIGVEAVNEPESES